MRWMGLYRHWCPKPSLGISNWCGAQPRNQSVLCCGCCACINFLELSPWSLKLYAKLTKLKRAEIETRATALQKKTVTRVVCKKTGKHKVTLSCKYYMIWSTVYMASCICWQSLCSSNSGPAQKTWRDLVHILQNSASG